MAIDLPITGGCACGEIRYECSDAPLFMFFCRCRGCQQATGGPFAANVWFPTPTVTITKGAVSTYSIDALTGRPSHHDFCQLCGSPIRMRAESWSEIRGLRAGSFDDPSILQPSANVWLSTKLPWDEPDSQLLCFEQNIGEGDVERIAALSHY